MEKLLISHFNGSILTKTDHSTKKIITYGYTDPTWADLLISYNGQTITYDKNRNPLHYNSGTAMASVGYLVEVFIR